MASPDRPTRMLVVVAHPDDETFGCGSLLAHATRTGMTTMVACATRGEAGTPPEGFDLSGRSLAEVRVDELHTAADLLGVDQVQVLDWGDSGMDGEPKPGTLCAAPLGDVTTAIAALLDEFEPDLVITLDASDGHRDHAHIRDATIAACAAASWRVGACYLHCLPRVLMAKWVAELARRMPDSDHLALGELGTPEEEITTRIDTSELLELREQAIAVHASQTSPYEVMPADLRAEFLTTERLKRVLPKWAGGAVERALDDSRGAARQ